MVGFPEDWGAGGGGETEEITAGGDDCILWVNLKVG